MKGALGSPRSYALPPTTLPWQVPLTILHNASSPHGFVSFLAAASALRWRARVGALGAAPTGTATGAAATEGAEAEGAEAEGAAAAAARRLNYAVHNHPLPLTEREELRVSDDTLVSQSVSQRGVGVAFCGCTPLTSLA